MLFFKLATVPVKEVPTISKRSGYNLLPSIKLAVARNFIYVDLRRYSSNLKKPTVKKLTN